MTDERLRDLERRWRQTGAQVDEEAMVCERTRAGENPYPPPYSRLAAYCGHAPSIREFGPQHEPSEHEPRPRDNLHDLFHGLRMYRVPTLMRAAVAALRLLLPDMARSTHPYAYLYGVRALDILIRWLPDHSHAASQEGAELGAQFGQEADPEYLPDRLDYHWASPAVFLCEMIGEIDEEHPLTSQEASIRCWIAVEAVFNCVGRKRDGIRNNADAVCTVWQAICEALIPWSLGEGDPALAPLPALPTTRHGELTFGD